eukprot:SAG31_NODE_197_length_20660_cov_8.861368_5_plen_177_part_00
MGPSTDNPLAHTTEPNGPPPPDQVETDAALARQLQEQDLMDAAAADCRELEPQTEDPTGHDDEPQPEDVALEVKALRAQLAAAEAENKELRARQLATPRAATGQVHVYEYNTQEFGEDPAIPFPEGIFSYATTTDGGNGRKHMWAVANALKNPASGEPIHTYNGLMVQSDNWQEKW